MRSPSTGGDDGQRRRAPQGRTPRAGLHIAYEDDDLLIADKPAGVPTAVPPEARTSQRTLFDLVKEHVRHHGVGRPRVWVVHRLDSEVSGLVVFAKSERAFEWLKDDLRARRVQRGYVALVEGRLGDSAAGSGGAAAPPAVGTIQAPIVDTGRGIVRVLPPDTRRPVRSHTSEGPLARDEPRAAITHYRVVASSEKFTLLRVRLETGRKHQIRAHLAHIGHPVVGDRRYGAQGDPLRRVALHAAEISFSHPVSGQSIRLNSPAPVRMWKLVGCEPPPQAASSVPAVVKQVPAAAKTAWEDVAAWYDDLVEDRRNDLHNDIVLPGALRLLASIPGERVLDLACGQGVLARALASQGVLVCGVDASPRLIDVAKQRSPRGPKFAVADATRLDQLPPDFCPSEGFDAAACVMALMNMDPLSSVIAGIASRLRPGGRFVAVLLHPVFRSPGRTSWGWDQGEGRTHQYRRIDSYLSPGHREIVMNPGKAVRGAKPVVTLTYHRPLQTYVQHLTDAGLLVDRLEEWPSPRRSEPGPRAEEENRARREIPVFLGLRAVKAGPGRGFESA
ncbi:MAG: methyltransferase domain-containing protein [Phycisphaerales bacterium]|nr:methyltransferase domain-containing protein [Phycisphaerales bacterium]